MSSKISSELFKIFLELSKNDKINFVVNNEVQIGNPIGELLNISDQGINSPFSDLQKKLSTKISPLPDQLPDYHLLNQLLEELNIQKAIKQLNHVGFCYHTDSQSTEKTKLLSEIESSSFKLYEEPSNDKGKWYFIGNTSNWNNPMIEMVPVESTGDTFIDYWLPHIHIDIDTDLDENQIESLFYKIYDGDPKPFRAVVIDDIVYVIRLRLGIINGINIFLDLATNHRNVENLRKNILKHLS